ncbi:MAG: UDP-N-acetylmuramate dehydrogenase [Oscillospiraceae bacterium]|jgi:UDP-N-acetylmuramate dehydrogenase|nr:UDP-N-acetylmuramate dehydrogenase [Oscillospiraceae bacterium]
MNLLSSLTTFRIGGPCDAVYTPESAAEMTALLKTLDCPTVLGRGSNILAADEGVRTPVILTAGLNAIRIEGDTLRAGCGVSLPELSRAAESASLTGLEWAGGIPGTVGGGTVMNAGAYGGQMSDVLVSVCCADRERDASECRFGYRQSVFTENPTLTVLEVTLKLTHGDPADISRRTEAFRKARNEKQPVSLPSAGSFFKRPEGHFAGALIERCGLKGVSVGGARVSEKHAGFLVNTGGATCRDVMILAERVRETVLRETGVALTPEVKLLGDISWSF